MFFVRLIILIFILVSDCQQQLGVERKPGARYKTSFYISLVSVLSRIKADQIIRFIIS